MLQGIGIHVFPAANLLWKQRNEAVQSAFLRALHFIQTLTKGHQSTLIWRWNCPLFRPRLSKSVLSAKVELSRCPFFLENRSTPHILIGANADPVGAVLISKRCWISTSRIIQSPDTTAVLIITIRPAESDAFSFALFYRFGIKNPFLNNPSWWNAVEEDEEHQRAAMTHRKCTHNASVHQ